VTQVPALWLQIHDGTVATASSLGATMIDSRPWFCSSSGYCPPFVGHTPTMRDAVHASLAYATKLGPTLVEELRSKGLVA
jgi:hypothetical protein